jgi:ATP-binding cassette subfamily B protein
MARPLPIALVLRHRALLAAGSALLLMESVAMLSLPWLGGQAAGRLADGLPTHGLLAALLGVAALQALLRAATTLLLGMVAADVLADLRRTVHDHLQSLPLSYHQSRRRGELMALLTHELSQLASFVSGTLVAALPALVTAAGAVILMLRIDTRLALLAAALVPVFYGVMKLAGRRLRRMAVQMQQADAATTAAGDENLALLPATKAFAREPQRNALYAQRVEAVRRLGHAGARAHAMFEPALQFIATAGAVLFLWFLARQVGQGRMPASEWVAFVLYGALLTRPVSALAALYGQAAMARGTLAHLEEVMATKPEPSGERRLTEEQARGDIAFEGVVFGYPGRTPVLRGFDLRIAAGETVALTGPNGAGKTTLVHLLVRLHEPQAGQVLIGGQDLRQLDLASLRSHIALVPQHVQLFHASVRENIAFGRPAASPQEVEAAARLAQADGFIRALPQGYDTPIGDEGVRLSGGQRQRLALARALLKDAPVLVLDEPTAMFDPPAEQAFVEALKALPGRRTVILITHRPASLALADRVVSLSPPG